MVLGEVHRQLSGKLKEKCSWHPHKTYLRTEGSFTPFGYKLLGASHAERLPNVTNVPKNTLVPQFDFSQSS